MATRLLIELDEQLADRLQAVAAREQKTIETFALETLARTVDDHEWAEDEAAYAEYERTGEAIPISEMEDWVRRSL